MGIYHYISELYTYSEAVRLCAMLSSRLANYLDEDRPSLEFLKRYCPGTAPIGDPDIWVNAYHGYKPANEVFIDPSDWNINFNLASTNARKYIFCKKDTSTITTTPLPISTEYTLVTVTQTETVW